MPRSTARVAVIQVTRAALFFALACGAERVERDGSPAVSFQTVENRPDFGATTVAPLDPAALARLTRTNPSIDDWRKILGVYAGDSIGLPMLGAYSVTGESLRFVPRFPPLRGTRYTGRFNGAAFNAASGGRAPAVVSDAVWMRELASGAATTTVAEVYPTVDSVPMNLLRMYVQFSAPMTVGDRADEHIRLVDERGTAVDKAFLVATGGQELWDPAHTRLTLFLDPGRIKRDLTPHDALGLSLRDGHSYILVVDSTLRDAHGLGLARGFTKRFRVGPIDRTLPRTSGWHVTVPKAGTLESLTIDFPEPLDHALLARMLAIVRASTADRREMRVAGHVMTQADDRRWTFTPAQPWDAMPHCVDIDTELEDLAGNNLKRLFDVMPGDSGSRGVEAARTRIAFRPR